MYKHRINAYIQTHKRNKLWKALNLSRESDADEKFSLQKAPREESDFLSLGALDTLGVSKLFGVIVLSCLLHRSLELVFLEIQSLPLKAL